MVEILAQEPHDRRSATLKTHCGRRLLSICVVVNRACESGVIELRHRDEDGNFIIDKRTGRPKVSMHVMLPDGRLAAQMLAVRNPSEWAPGRSETTTTELAWPDELPAAASICCARQ